MRLTKPLLTLLLIAVLFNINFASKKNTVAGSAGEICPVLTGTVIPDVSVATLEGNDVKLKELVSKQQTVLIFYRGGWCPYCNTHLSELYDMEKELAKLGYQILAVSMDKPQKLRETLDEKELSYTLLSDSDAEAVTAFGLAYKVDSDLVEKYLEHGLDLEGSSGQTHHILPVPAAFVLDTGGVIQFSYVNPDYKVRVKSAVLLEAAIEAIK